MGPKHNLLIVLYELEAIQSLWCIFLIFKSHAFHNCQIDSTLWGVFEEFPFIYMSWCQNVFFELICLQYPFFISFDLIKFQVTEPAESNDFDVIEFYFVYLLLQDSNVLFRAKAEHIKYAGLFKFDFRWSLLFHPLKI